MKTKVIYSVLILFLLSSCKDEKTNYSYWNSMPLEIKNIKSRIDTLEKLNLPGTEEEVRAMKINTAIAETNYLETWLLQIKSMEFDKKGRALNEEELSELKKQVKYDSIKASLDNQLTILRK